MEFSTKTAKKQKEAYVISFMHGGRRYKLEMMIQTNHNLLGSGVDYLICQILDGDSDLAAQETSAEHSAIKGRR